MSVDVYIGPVSFFDPVAMAADQASVQAILRLAAKPEQRDYDEELHPRGDDGRWVAKDEGASGAGASNTAPRARGSWDGTGRSPLADPVNRWAASKPWNASVGDLRAGKYPELVVATPDQLSSYVVAQYQADHILINPAQWDEGRGASNQLLLFHEAGHAISQVAFGHHHDEVYRLLEPFKEGATADRTGRFVGYHMYVSASTRPEEILADIYSDIASRGRAAWPDPSDMTPSADPSGYARNRAALWDFVERTAKEIGYPTFIAKPIFKRSIDLRYSEDQPRDEHGQWTADGGGDVDHFIASLPTQHDPSLHNEATTKNGKILLGPKFDALTPAAQKAVLLHEAAHLHGLDDWYLRTHDDWNLAAKTEFGHLNGQTTPGEIMVEAYATAWTDPQFLQAHAPALIPIVREGAVAVKLPLPPEGRSIQSPSPVSVDDPLHDALFGTLVWRFSGTPLEEAQRYSPDQPRDESGRWSADGDEVTGTRSWDGFPFDQRTGQAPHEKDTPPERTAKGDFILYHGTSDKRAQQILKERTIRHDDMGRVGVATTVSAAAIYSVMKQISEGAKGGGAVLRVVIKQDWLGQQLIDREIGGSGHDQFLIEQPHGDRRGPTTVPPEAIQAIRIVRQGGEQRFRPDQERDEFGRWTDEGGGTTSGDSIHSNISSNLRAWEAKHTSDLKETAVVERDGKTIMTVSTNSSTSVSFTHEQEAQMRGAVLTHNHPGGDSFSTTDLSFAAMVGLKEIRVTGEGRTYSFSRKDGGNIRLYDWRVLSDRFVQHALTRAQNICHGYVYKGLATEIEARHLVADVAWKIAAEKHPTMVYRSTPYEAPA